MKRSHRAVFAEALGNHHDLTLMAAGTFLSQSHPHALNRYILLLLRKLINYITHLKGHVVKENT